MSEPSFIFGSVMKTFLSQHFFLRMLSLAILPATIICDAVCTGGLDAAGLCVDLWWGVQILLQYPSSHEPAAPSLRFAGTSFALALVLKIMGISAGVAVSCGTIALMAYAIYKSYVKFAQIPPLFHVAAVWQGVEDYMYLLHMVICVWAGAMIPVLAGTGWPGWSWAGVLGTLYLAQYYRVYKRTTLFLRPAKEELIRRSQRGSAFKQPIQYVDSDSRSAALFNDVVRIMETRRPWLQDGFSIEELARLTRTNRMYLSKAINFHSGRNFNQMVNCYRVRYATELMRKDPNLRMNEVSQMCGFHTVVTFNMAFKLNERMTPTQFVQSLKKIQ